MFDHTAAESALDISTDRNIQIVLLRTCHQSRQMELKYTCFVILLCKREKIKMFTAQKEGLGHAL